MPLPFLPCLPLLLLPRPTRPLSLRPLRRRPPPSLLAFVWAVLFLLGPSPRPSTSTPAPRWKSEPLYGAPSTTTPDPVEACLASLRASSNCTGKEEAEAKEKLLALVRLQQERMFESR